MLEKGSLFGESNRYELVEHIGSGGFSQVWKARDLQMRGDIVALKIFAWEIGLDVDGIKMLQEEFKVVDNISHTHLLKSKHFAVHNSSPYLVMPFCPNGSLRKVINSNIQIDDEELLRLFYEVGGALSVLHDTGIIHSDVKPDNILLGEFKQYLLTDFGTSRKTRSNLTSTIGRSSFHSVSYSPPERYEKTPADLPAGDIFSLGVTAYEMAIKNVPWDGQGGIALVSGAQVPDISEKFNPFLRDVICRCMSRDPLIRPTAPELKDWAEKCLFNKGVNSITPITLKDKPTAKQKPSVLTVKMDRKNPPSAEQITMPVKAIAEAKESSGKKKSVLVPIVAVFLVVITISLFFIFKPHNETRSASPSLPPQRIDTLTISGKVIDSALSLPINNAHLRLKQGNLTIKACTTGSNGIFSFNSLKADSFSVVLTSMDSGYSTPVSNYRVFSGDQSGKVIVFFTSKKLVETNHQKQETALSEPPNNYSVLKNIRVYSRNAKDPGTIKLFCECRFNKKPGNIDTNIVNNFVHLFIPNAVSYKNEYSFNNDFMKTCKVTQLSNQRLRLTFNFEDIQPSKIKILKESDTVLFSISVADR